MMVQIRSQAGMSLADVYDVQGSIAGVEQLESRGVQLIHEMGGTIFSERLAGRILVASTGATIQNTDFSANMAQDVLPQVTARIIQVLVSVDTTSRLARCAVVLRESFLAQEIPIWVWDGSNETSMELSVGAPTATLISLDPNPAYTRLPTLQLGGNVSATHDWRIFLRGTTSGFGAGDVDVTMHVHFAFPDSRGSGLSSRGLPIPSW